MRGEKTQIFRTKVPTLNDNGFIVTESRPIATYLSEKYGKDDKLYPKDLGVRSTVDARLYFDIGTFYKAFGDCVVSKTFKRLLNLRRYYVAQILNFISNIICVHYCNMGYQIF